MLNQIQEAADYIRKKMNHAPQTAIVLGSGLGDFAQNIQGPIEIRYEDIPHFKQTSVTGHAGKIILGKINGHSVIVQQGRLHMYEGHDITDVVLPVRTFKLLGVENLILTNASGGINSQYKPGDLICIKDHINMTGKNPLIGKNIDEIGPRFPDMSEVYNKELLHQLETAFKKIGLNFQTGIYCSVLGPSYETPAEVRMFKTLGADMVGMSTVPEAIAAHHCGLRVAGIACITNLASGISLEVLKHEDVKDEANKVKDKFSNLLLETISLLQS